MAEPVRVGDLLTALPGMAERLAEARLVAAWPAIAGPGAVRSRAEGVEGGILRVAVDGSGWLHRLTLEEAALLARCHAVAPTANLRGVRFRLAPVETARPAPIRSAAPLEARGPLDPEAAAAIDATLSPVRAHPAIAEALGRAMMADHRVRGVRVEGETPR